MIIKFRLSIIAFLLQTGIALAQTDNVVTVKCDADTSQSYSVCLPADYSKAQKYPALFLFDPDARGKMIAALYQKATDYGFVLIASNNSRNGPMNESLNAANSMFADAFKKYCIDDQQVYLAGFSGGARVATTIALQSDGTAGVIACGAGFGEPIPNKKLSWTLAGIAGNQDFNYVEMQQVAQQLDASGSINSLQIFNGPHRWPPQEVFFSALLWSYMQHTKPGSNDKLLNHYKLLLNNILQYNSSAITQGALYRQYLSITPDADFTEKLKSLEASKTYLDEVAKAKQINIKENTYQLKIIAAFQFIMANNTAEIKSKSWWKGELSNINKLLLTHTPSDSNYVARQKAFIIGNSNENFYNYYSAKRYDTAAELLTISEIFEQDNALVFYRHALLAAGEKDDGNTLYYLDQAFKHGFNDKERLRGEPAFRFLSGNKRFAALLN